MTATLEALPDQVRTHVSKMRELVRIIESAPLDDVVIAIGNLKNEIDQLVTHANEASGIQAQEIAATIEERRKRDDARREKAVSDLIDKHRRGNTNT